MANEFQPIDDPQWFRDMVEGASGFAILSMDPDGKIVTWNSGAEALLGFSRREVLGQPARMLFTPEDIATGAHEREIGIAAMEGHALDDRWHVRRDGSRVWVSGLLMAMRGEGGLVRGFVKVIQDKTEQKRLEEDLRSSEEQFARVFLGNPAAMSVERVDNGTFVLANESFFQLTGYWRSEVMGRSGDALGIWADPARRERMMRGLEEGQTISARVEIRTKSGTSTSCAATFGRTQLGDIRCVLGSYIPLDFDE